MLRCSKKVTKSSISFKEDPPVETMTGLRVVAIFSIKIQSFKSEEAILISCTPNLTHMSTDFSSKGVAMVRQLFLRTVSTKI